MKLPFNSAGLAFDDLAERGVKALDLGKDALKLLPSLAAEFLVSKALDDSHGAKGSAEALGVLAGGEYLLGDANAAFGRLSFNGVVGVDVHGFHQNVDRFRQRGFDELLMRVFCGDFGAQGETQ